MTTLTHHTSPPDPPPAAPAAVRIAGHNTYTGNTLAFVTIDGVETCIRHRATRTQPYRCDEHGKQQRARCEHAKALVFELARYISFLSPTTDGEATTL